MNDTLIPPNDKEKRRKSTFNWYRFNPEHTISKRSKAWEFAYQLAVTTVLLIFFSFNMDQTEEFRFRDLFAPYKLAFFSNYLAAAMLINYVLLPWFYAKKRTVLFVITLLILLVIVVLVDEFFLEKIYFPDTRGTYFPGFSYTVVETLPIIIIMVAFKLAWDFGKKQHEVEKLKSLVKESEIQFLKSQINPHFLFNNLNNIYAYAMDYSPKTPAIILDLSSVLRYMLYDAREDQIGINKEVDHLKKYIALFQLQLNKRGRINFVDDVLSEQYSLPPLILVVFVENAFKHSTGSQASNIEIDIRLKVTEKGVLHFQCKNNYCPIHQTTESASGIGLENIIKRLELLYPKNHRLEISKSANLFSVDLEIPLKKNNHD